MPDSSMSPTEAYTRARLVKLHVDELADEAKRCTDSERIRAIRDEIETCIASLREIHREQLTASLAPVRPAVSRRRWRFWR